MKYFCSKCGKTTLYNLEIPKFCSSCGQIFGSKLDNNELKLKNNTKEDNSYESEFNIYEIKNINFKKIKPSFKLDIYQNTKETFGSLIENPSQPLNLNLNNNIIETKTKEQVLQEFQKEAGLSRIEE